MSFERDEHQESEPEVSSPAVGTALVADRVEAFIFKMVEALGRLEAGTAGLAGNPSLRAGVSELKERIEILDSLVIQLRIRGGIMPT